LIFSFFNSNSNLNFSTGCYRWVPLPYPAVVAVTAVYGAVTTGRKNPEQVPASCVLQLLVSAVPARRSTRSIGGEKEKTKIGCCSCTDFEGQHLSQFAAAFSRWIMCSVVWWNFAAATQKATKRFIHQLLLNVQRVVHKAAGYLLGLHRFIPSLFTVDYFLLVISS
jgi:hypothetical protein